jgi:hypothetical protein
VREFPALEPCQGCEFERDFGREGEPDAPRLIKLHGCVSDGQIIPPTWRKGASDGLARQWAAARDVLSQANHLRVVGYSLPVSDSYVRYLLKATLSGAPHLKSIDVLTLNPEDEVRYRSFITFRDMRFRTRNAADYLRYTFVPNARRLVRAERPYDFFEFDLEEQHALKFEPD